jgi:hypothetical protein
MSAILNTLTKVAIPIGAAVSFLQYSMYDGKNNKNKKQKPKPTRSVRFYSAFVRLRISLWLAEFPITK